MEQEQIRELLQYHHRHSWLPFTQMQLAPEPLVVERGEGSYLITADGKRILDAIGSWWVSIHGHNHPAIMDAIRRQLDRLDHVIYTGFIHEPGARLAHELSETTGGALPRVFYSDNGSTAVEIGLKMAFQYFVNAGRSEKKGILALEDGYHGDTIGTMSVGGRSVFHKMYEPLLFPVHLLKAPRVPFSSQGNAAQEAELLRSAIEELENYLEAHGSTTCSLILEPLIQGASGGMAIYPARYLKRARELCDRHEVFLIADEVFTGFGRTGTMYAFEQAGVWPDIMALAKGLSGGVLPFAATICTEKVYGGFLSGERSHTLFHGHSMTGNPPGAAAALASLELFRSEKLLDEVKRLEKAHGRHLSALAGGPLRDFIKEIRYLGSVGVVELRGEGGYTASFGWEFSRRCLEKGVYLRPLGSSIYLTPPYTTSDLEMERIYEVLESSALEILK